MSARPSITIHDHDLTDPPQPDAGAPTAGEDDTPERELPTLGNKSILEAVRAGYAEERADEDDTRVYKVGRAVPQLFSRYRPLGDDERENLDRRIRTRVKQQKRVGQYDEAEAKIEEAALVLSHACVELVWEEDGVKEPLHVRLAEASPIRFDRRLVDILGLADIARFQAAEGAADITAAMHYWAGHHGSLLSTYGLYKVWAQGVDVEDLSEALEGN